MSFSSARSLAFAILLTGLPVQRLPAQRHALRPTVSTGRERAPVVPSTAALVHRYLDARGGLDSIRGVKNIVYRGRPGPDGRARFLAKARPFFYVVGEPSLDREFGEGSDGTPWEYYRSPGLLMRTSGAPAAASRHTAYFDEPLVYFGATGWRFSAVHQARFAGRDAWAVRATYPDGYWRDLFVDPTGWLVVGFRHAVPVHAFGPTVLSETRISGYRRFQGALFPTRFEEADVTTGRVLDEAGAGWESVAANVPLAEGFFSPPPAPATPLARALNTIFAARAIPHDVLGWVAHFRADSTTASVLTEQIIGIVGFQLLKNGAIPSGVALLEANVREAPTSADAWFSLGRAYRAASQRADARRAWRRALAIDPAHARTLAAVEPQT